MLTIERTPNGWSATLELDGKEYTATADTPQRAFQAAFFLYADDK